MIDEEKLLTLAKTFDRPGVKVVGTVPRPYGLADVVGIHQYEDKTTKITIRKGPTLYLCWVPTSEVIEDIVRFKEEIRQRDDWRERWEPWELSGSTEPLSLQTRIVKSRLRDAQERKEERGLA